MRRGASSAIFTFVATNPSERWQRTHSHRFDLWWNSVFLNDDGRRAALATIVSLIYVAFLGAPRRT
jgi:hypothetical protein